MEKEVEENLEMLLGDLGELTVQKLSLQNILNGRVERTLQELPRTFLNWPAENLQIYMEKRVEENLEMALGLGEVTLQERILENILKERLGIPLQELPRTLLKWPAENLQIHMEKEREANLEMLLEDPAGVTIQKLRRQKVLKKHWESSVEGLLWSLLQWHIQGLRERRAQRRSYERPTKDVESSSPLQMGLKRLLTSRQGAM
ncbi:LOW QUALITY PROTEIN: hypothetical protein ENH_00012700 [Eimeria necatrix]|uniref:Uncharacterized protein n=1 Tax=Eimeria necatrix TaxID=51315 RepID=U6MRM6_9EIME|nr:LOW QUALITY PROTEIN: hypothetical protein ENH_00012700 [Eimeria necatrix]CDJ65743.1 hypothetical protein ENH_00012700 [Eimeria necatrix]